MCWAVLMVGRSLSRLNKALFGLLLIVLLVPFFACVIPSPCVIPSRCSRPQATESGRHPAGWSNLDTTAGDGRGILNRGENACESPAPAQRIQRDRCRFCLSFRAVSLTVRTLTLAMSDDRPEKHRRVDVITSLSEENDWQQAEQEWLYYCTVLTLHEQWETVVSRKETLAALIRDYERSLYLLGLVPPGRDIDTYRRPYLLGLVPPGLDIDTYRRPEACLMFELKAVFQRLIRVSRFCRLYLV